jgi:hypothetical protein
VSSRYFITLTEQDIAAYSYHVGNFRKLSGSVRTLEFGAGSHLLSALMLSAAGAEEVYAYDLSRIATVEQVNHVIRQLPNRIIGSWPEIVNLDEDLMRRYRIRYCAPADTRMTGLPAGSVDLVLSTSTLEHIPQRDIVRILRECQRVASTRALFSFIIDYHDHYASADSTITRVNFYRYSDAMWRTFNPSSHYQNRLRHSDYERLFLELGLRFVDNRSVLQPIEIGALHSRFQKYSASDLMALNGFFTLRQADPGDTAVADARSEERMPGTSRIAGRSQLSS